jgi:4-deoxy-L-threo-5-hexosulose-uronate ketol-isomerase
MSMHYVPDKERMLTMSSAELKDSFVMSDLFRDGEQVFVVADLDRVILGGVVPTTGPITLQTPPETTTERLTDRRELGILNIGGAGTVTVDGNEYSLQPRSCLYVGRGAGDVVFGSESPENPAVLYLVSYPCVATFPTALVNQPDVTPVELGSSDEANERKLYKYIHPDGIQSGQLVMGITVMQPGSIWNTMPPHTHERRSEVYLYFGIEAPNVVVHLMGPGSDTRHVVIRDREAVLSPPWSIHAGAGTRNYMFCWAMGGENQAFSDMDAVPLDDLR